MLGDLVVPNTVYGEGRRCTHVDPESGEQRITLLCRMNPGPACFIHSAKVRLALVDEPARQREQGAYAELRAA